MLRHVHHWDLVYHCRLSEPAITAHWQLRDAASAAESTLSSSELLALQDRASLRYLDAHLHLHLHHHLYHHRHLCLLCYRKRELVASDEKYVTALRDARAGVLQRRQVMGHGHRDGLGFDDGYKIFPYVLCRLKIAPISIPILLSFRLCRSVLRTLLNYKTSMNKGHASLLRFCRRC